MKGESLFVRPTRAGPRASAAHCRKLELDGVVAIELENAVGPTADRPARPSTLVLTKPGHHVFLRLPIFSDGPSLREWHGAIAARLPESVRISSAGGCAAVAASRIASAAKVAASSVPPSPRQPTDARPGAPSPTPDLGKLAVSHL